MPQTPSPHTIHTSRLCLTPVTSDDLSLYLTLLTNPTITRYLPGGKPFSPDDIEQYVAKKITHWQKGVGTFAVALADAPATKIGYAGVEQLPDMPHCDIRYGMLPEHQGRGYALEAATAVLHFMQQHTTISEVYGVAQSANHASIHLLRKLGMQPSLVTLYTCDDLSTFSIPLSSFTMP